MKFRFMALAGLIAASAASADTTLKDGVYTSDQAQRGQKTYETNCKDCHNADFYKQKLAGWNQAPLIEFYDLIAGTMPQTMPGGLSDEEYADALAHIFALLGYPAGEKELSYTDGTMEEIVIVTN